MSAPSAKRAVVGNGDNLVTASVIWLPLLLSQKYKKKGDICISQKSNIMNTGLAPRDANNIKSVGNGVE